MLEVARHIQNCKGQEGLLREGIWVRMKVLTFPEYTKLSYGYFFQGESRRLKASGEGLWDTGGEGKHSQAQVTPKGNLFLSLAFRKPHEIAHLHQLLLKPQ